MVKRWVRRREPFLRIREVEGFTEQAGLFQQCFEHCNDAIMISDTEGKVSFVNSAFSYLYGYSEAEVLGQPVSLIRHDNSLPETFTRMWKDISSDAKGFWRGEIRNRRKDGSSVDVMLTIAAVKDKSGATIAYMSIALDITDKVNINKQMVEREKLSSIGLLASGIAHEIGSPLNVISGRAEMAKNQLNKHNPEAAKSLEIIVEQTDRISELIKGLLNFSRPLSVTKPQDFSEVDMVGVLDECRTLLNKSMRDLNVKFSVDGEPEAVIQWDFYKCEQIFINLLQNAIHAVEGTAAPEIGVTFRSMTAAELSELEFSDGKGVAVEFRDNGSGIPEESLGRVFDPFFTTKDPGMGTGLGLSVVYGLVKEINGTIKVNNRRGGGTVFTLLLPRASRSAGREPAAVSPT
jgi:PAS domain S-box-containing protein